MSSVYLRVAMKRRWERPELQEACLLLHEIHQAGVTVWLVGRGDLSSHPHVRAIPNRLFFELVERQDDVRTVLERIQTHPGYQLG